jgi:predicted glycoside hydrolase/deacetylase ChbG (UPF0249 family)
MLGQGERMSEIRLIVQADDLGMCHAVNTGVARAFREGIATQTSVMAPCPWIAEGLEMARRDALPAGVHCTLTCEWENVRWGPLSDGASLRAEDGGFHRTVAEVVERADADEAKVELCAQADRLIEAGVEPLYFDGHMGPTCVPAFEHVTTVYERPFVYPLTRSHVALDSISMLSHKSAEKKLPWMLEYLDGLEAGTHFLCTHPGERSEELRALTPPDAENHPWAEDLRVTDLETLCAPEVRESVERRKISLVSVADLG